MQYVHNPTPKTHIWADPATHTYWQQLAEHNERKARFWHAQYLAVRKSLEARYAQENPGAGID